jgi:poly(A) polymerase
MTVTIRILSPSEHCLSPTDVDPDALKIIHRLHRMGFLAYLCGGAVRDLLLGRKPKDFDIATDARPGQIRKRFANVFIIGRRFRLAHVHFPGGKIIEVATFRRDLSEEERAVPTEKIAPELLYGTPREDAFRRDVTINALYYDALSGEIIDYAGGLEDLPHRRVRIIGDPGARYTEDAVRIWRVVRYAARLGFDIEKETARAIPAFAPLLGKCAGARLYEELNKELGEKTRPVMDALRAHGLLRHIIGGFGEDYESDDALYGRLRGLLDIKDRVQKDGLELTREEIYALFFWPWAEAFFAGKDGDIRTILEKAFESAGMQAAFPRKIRTDVVHILTTVAQIAKAFRFNRPNWALRRQAAFESAFRVHGLIENGRPPEPGDAPVELFGRAHPPAGEESPKKRRPRRRRGPRRAPQT